MLPCSSHSRCLRHACRLLPPPQGWRLCAAASGSWVGHWRLGDASLLPPAVQPRAPQHSGSLQDDVRRRHQGQPGRLQAGAAAMAWLAPDFTNRQSCRPSPAAPTTMPHGNWRGGAGTAGRGTALLGGRGGAADVAPACCACCGCRAATLWPSSSSSPTSRHAPAACCGPHAEQPRPPTAARHVLPTPLPIPPATHTACACPPTPSDRRPP